MILIIFFDGVVFEGVDILGLVFDVFDGVGFVEVLIWIIGCGVGGGGGDMDEGFFVGSDLWVFLYVGRGFWMWLLLLLGSGFLIGLLFLGRGFLVDFELLIRGVLGKEFGRDVWVGEGERVLLRIIVRCLGFLVFSVMM